MELYDHQIKVLEETKDKNRVAYYLDMGLGKTYAGSEKAISLGKNILVICQKSKVDDWVNHFKYNYGELAEVRFIYDLTKRKCGIDDFIPHCEHLNKFRGLCNDFAIGVINYELAWRRKELSNLTDFTLILDESSLIQNETSKRAKFILNKLHPSNVILLSGTPTSGKYERLWSQMKLLGWSISKKMYYNHYVDVKLSDDGYPIIVGYKNVDRLKRKMREYGCVFMKTDEVMNLPLQNFITVSVAENKEYKRFKKHSIVEVGDKELVGDTTLTKLLYSRMLCGHYNEDKLKAFKDLVESTEDRLIVFYNFNDELEALKSVLPTDRLISIVNGQTKDLKAYDECESSITFIQYQAGSMGLNLQKANKIIYFTPTLSSELFEQSKKRTHRIGQERACYYYLLKCGIEHRIYDTLAMRKDFTDELFKESEGL